jgi:putative flippase GtrA
MLGPFVRFSGAGAIGTVAHYAVLVLLVEIASIHPAIAAACGATVGATVNYLLNYRITFRSTARHTFAAPRFALVALVGMALNAGVVFQFVRLGGHYLLGQVAATLLVLILGFLASQFWVFSESRNDDSRK